MKLRKWLTIALSGSLIFLAGCSQMDTAATVGERKIALSELQGEVDSILAERALVDTTEMQLESGESLTRSQLSFMIANIIIAAIADDLKVKVLKSEIDAYAAEIYLNIGGEENLPSVLVSASIPPEGLADVLRRDLVLRKISDKAIESGVAEAELNDYIQKLVAKKAEELGVEVNPRYGKWDADALSVVESNSTGGAVEDK
jgi:hypothetical protein